MIKDNILEEIRRIAIVAGELILDIYHDFDVNTVVYKNDESPLTKADQAANDYIVSQLKKWDSDIPIISEEGKEIPFSARKGFNKYWVVDPLDGTKEFIKKNGEFTVNIALCEGSRPILGVVHAPVLGTTYFAQKGDGAYKNTDDKIKRIKCHPYDPKSEGIRIVVSRSHMNDETKSYIDGFNKPVLVPTGSSLKFLLVSEGQADCYPRLGPTMEWDTAAAQIIVEEAGGSVLRADNLTPLIYNKENLLNPSFVVQGPSI